MSVAIRFSDLAVGAECPQLRVEIDREALVRYAGASDDYVAQHWDHPFMIAQGYPDVIGHGWLTFAHMSRAVTNWMPPAVAAIGGFNVRYHRPFYPGTMTCGGRIEVIDGSKATLSLWARDGHGETIAAGGLWLRAREEAVAG